MYRGNERIVVGEPKEGEIFSIHHSDLEAWGKWQDELNHANKRIKELEDKLELIRQVIM